MATYLTGQLLKGSGPEIYVIDGPQRRWIPDPTTFQLNGYNWAAVLTIPDAELQSIPLGPQIEAFTELLFPADASQSLPPDAKNVAIVQYGAFLFGRWRGQGGGRTVYARCELNLQTGIVNGETVTENAVVFDGYHSGTKVILVDQNGIGIASSPTYRYGVQPKGISSQSIMRTDTWQWNAGAADASRTTLFYALVSDSPDTLEQACHTWIGSLVTPLIPLVSAIGGLFGSKPVTTGGGNGGTTNPKGSPGVTTPAPTPAPNP